LFEVGDEVGVGVVVASERGDDEFEPLVEDAIARAPGLGLDVLELVGDRCEDVRVDAGMPCFVAG
jgi:hypothetical protein